MTSRANPPHGWSPEMAASPFALVTPIYWGQMWSAATTEFTADHSRQKVGAFFLHFPGFSTAPQLGYAPRPPFDLLRSFGCLQLWAAAQFNCPLPPNRPVGETTHGLCQQMRGHPDDGV